MQTHFSTHLGIYFITIGVFLLIALAVVFYSVMAAIFCFAIAFIALLIAIGDQLEVNVLEDSILMTARFGFITDRVYYHEIQEMTGSRKSGVVTRNTVIQSTIYRETLTIKLKTGEEYVFTNSQIWELMEMAAAIRTKMETQPPSSPTV
ncbi:MAG: hypothetical protein U0T75_16730 [Chitinophagales bacterium]